MEILSRSFNLETAGFSPDLDPLLQRIYQSRGVSSQGAHVKQLSCLPAPSLLRGMLESV